MSGENLMRRLYTTAAWNKDVPTSSIPRSKSVMLYINIRVCALFAIRFHTPRRIIKQSSALTHSRVFCVSGWMHNAPIVHAHYNRNHLRRTCAARSPLYLNIQTQRRSCPTHAPRRVKLIPTKQFPATFL